MKLQLSNSISSSRELSALIHEIREYAKWYARYVIRQRVGVTNTPEQPTISPIAIELLRRWGEGKPLTQKQIDELIVELEHFKDSAPTLTITLAAPATRDIREAIVSWCRENIASNVLVTFQFNSGICGGMVVRVGSRVHDWSFRRQILASKDKFPEILRNV